MPDQTRTTLQKAAAAWCLLMVAFLAVLQFGTDSHPPLFLFLIFSGVWIFGAAMLWWVPTFGAIGTALYGVILGVQLFRAHGFTSLNAGLGAASFIGSVLAVLFLVERLRSR